MSASIEEFMAACNEVNERLVAFCLEISRACQQIADDAWPKLAPIVIEYDRQQWQKRQPQFRKLMRLRKRRKATYN